MGIPLLDSVLQRVTLDRRVLSAAALVSVVAVLGRFFDPSLQVAFTAGLLGGVVNGLRTGEWEFASTYGALPGLIGGGVLTAVLTLSIPLGYYEFPFQTGVNSGLHLMGPIAELHLFVILYLVEGWLAFIVTRKLTGPNAISRLRWGTP